MSTSGLFSCGMVEIVRRYQEENLILKNRIKELEKQIEEIKGESKRDEAIESEII